MGLLDRLHGLRTSKGASDEKTGATLPTSNASSLHSHSLHGEKEVEAARDGSHQPHDDADEPGLQETTSNALSRIDTGDYPSALPLALILVGLCMAVFLVALDLTM